MTMPSQYPGPDPDQAAEGRPWWKACCTGCCLGIVVLLVVVPLAMRFLFHSAPERVQAIPENFPSQLLLFRPEEAVEIVYYPASSKGKVAQVVGIPLAWIGKLRTPDSVSSSTASVKQVGDAIQAELRRAEGRDTLAIRWTDLDVTRDEVLRFYAGALKQAGLPAPKARRDAGTNVDELLSQRSDIRFSLLLTDDAAIPGVESVSVVVEYVVE